MKKETDYAIEKFRKAAERLKQGVLQAQDELAQDGVIQRFEFTFELAWKLMREVLLYRGKEVNSPRIAIKEAFKERFFEDGDGWIKMLEDRNLTSHTYKQDLAKEIYERIKNKHYALLKELKEQMNKIIGS